MPIIEKDALTSMRIGVSNVVWCELELDNGKDIPTYSANVYDLPGVMSLNINPNSSSSTAFFDDGPGEIATTLGNIEVTFNKSALSPKEKAMLLGKVYLSNKALVSGSADIPRLGALGFRTLKSNGLYKYVWLYKGKFTEPSDNNETKGESINFQSDEIVGRFVKLNYRAKITPDVGSETTKQIWKAEFDPMSKTQDATTKNIIAKWFTKVPTPGNDKWTEGELDG